VTYRSRAAILLPRCEPSGTRRRREKSKRHASFASWQRFAKDGLRPKAQDFLRCRIQVHDSVPRIEHDETLGHFFHQVDPENGNDVEEPKPEHSQEKRSAGKNEPQRGKVQPGEWALRRIRGRAAPARKTNV
jgi:hypothetical protein